MPELPEVETTRLGILPKLKQQTIQQVVINHYQLRWPIPKQLNRSVSGQRINDIQRRGKYLLMSVGGGTVIIHLGMSGHMKLVPEGTPYAKHDHVSLIMDNGWCLRYNDPRRFGAWLWTKEAPEQHPLLNHLGPEPLSNGFDLAYFMEQVKKRKAPIKQVIMDSKVVVGVGNIYANEALFQARIHPKRAANRISAKRLEALLKAIKSVLRAAIKQGGTTLKDFSQSDGKPGYFKQSLQVYGRGQQPCYICTTPLSEIRLGQRTTVYCSQCQR